MRPRVFGWPGDSRASCRVVMVLAAVTFIAAPPLVFVSVACVPLAAAFAVGYAVLLSICSASVDEGEQGWVMGVSISLWTLGAGLAALVGGELMAFDIDAPILVASGAAVIALMLMATTCRSADTRRITGPEAKTSNQPSGDP